MAQEHSATCGACGHGFIFLKGGLMSSIQTVCDTCGLIDGVPRYAPCAEPMSAEQIVAMLEPEARASWPPRGRTFSQQERAEVDRLTTGCGCGGVRLRDGDSRLKYRCPVCRSDRLERVRTTWRMVD